MSRIPKSRADGKEVPFAGGKFFLSHRLGSGSFGDIFEGVDALTQQPVAVKLEKKKIRYQQLEYESKVYRVLHQAPIGMYEAIPPEPKLSQLSNSHEPQDALDNSGNSTAAVKHANRFVVVGIPQLLYYGSEGDYNIMVIELCGPSLEDLFNYCHRRFSLKTVLMLADQMLHRIQYVHDRGFVHRDIKPENFVFGRKEKAHALYLIDFGLSKLYWNCRKNIHIPFLEGKPLTGTARYCSANTHRGYEQSRRDDLESIGFLFIYFLKGVLPWQGIQAKDQQLKTVKIGECKISTDIDDLCRGLPNEFHQYCRYCRSLSFQQKPDYAHLRGLFSNLAQRCGYMSTAAAPSRGNDSDATKQLNGQANAAAASGASAAGGLSSASTAAAHVNESGSSAKQSLHTTDSDTASRHGPAPHKKDSTKPSTQTKIAEPDASRVTMRYDWMFDWFTKRASEVSHGLEMQTQRKLEAESAAAANTNTSPAGGTGDIISGSMLVQEASDNQGAILPVSV